MNSDKNIWVVIPAAGVGRRMKTDTPKQYLLLNDKTVLEHTLAVFDKHDAVSEVVVAVSKEDGYWAELNVTLSKPLHKVDGGEERCDSVLNALNYLQDKAALDDWVLVHDAARPCLRHEDLTLLLHEIEDEEAGGILAIPVRDTMKRAANNSNIIKETVVRENLWHALTPQMFRYGLLREALKTALNNNKQVTDEASAIELTGKKAVLVEGHADNIKITRPEDLALAAFFLKHINVDALNKK